MKEWIWASQAAESEAIAYYCKRALEERSMKMKSKSTLPREFAAKTASKPDAVKKAQKSDDKSDKAIAKRFGVKAKK
jgi:hypothetical protein